MTPFLETEDIRLVPFAAEHVPAFAAMIADPEILRFTRVPDPTPPDFPETWLRDYEEGRLDGSRESFAIVDIASGAFLGVGVAPSIDREARTVELGYVIAPDARGRGIATRTLGLLTEWAFDTLDAKRLELWISVDNFASKRVAEHCGYTFEGTLRGMHFKQDRWEDGEIWSRLPTDP